MTTEQIVTSDLSKFGSRERQMLIELLQAWRDQGLPEDFDGTSFGDVTAAFNTQSGCVFLTNSDYQTAMMNGDKLESWYSCPCCGHEGFREDMLHGTEPDPDCTEYLQYINVLEADSE